MIKNVYSSSQKSQNIIITDGSTNTNISVEDIIYVQAEHVYIRIHLTNKKQVLHRNSLQRFLNKLPAGRFIQIHRSYIINGQFVRGWNNDKVYLPGGEVPISRSRRKILNKLLLSVS